MTKRLYRSKTDKKIWVLGTLMSLFLGVAAYIACAFIIPEEPDTIDADFEEKK